MSASDFLLELRCEEIPARMQAGARADLERLFRREMEAAGVAPGAITVWSTPRRLALIARDLPARTEAVREETKGPRSSAPPQALEGFLRKTGLSRDQLEDRDGVYFAVVEKPGRVVGDVLAAAIPAIVRAFPWPKSMRWGEASLSSESPRWVRPLSGIVAILGEELVECTAAGVTSGYVTLGHRFHHPGEITIGGAADYQERLRACHVIVDHAEREALIREGAASAAASAGLALVEDEGLVVENAGLTEWPVPLLGRFDPEFLEVPPEVIQLTARVNQKYFVCERDGVLADAFVCTANIDASDGGAAIVDGNRKVLAARLSDARFFWEQDRKTPLAEQARKLERITFHEKLGTVADKVERVAQLARSLVEQGIVGGSADLAEQAARLCKADLVTEMVGEFPELQGLMGGYYARAEGLPDAVADAVRDHYKPIGQGDEVPTAPVTVAVSLADKLDTLRSFFSIDEKPTGSKDPFALRRAALGVIRLVLGNGVRANLSAWMHAAFNAHDQAQDGKDASNQPHTAQAAGKSLKNDEQDLLSFLHDRLKVHLRDQGIRHDVIDAVLHMPGNDDLVLLVNRATALNDMLKTEDGTNLLQGLKRANNILAQAEDKDGVEYSFGADPKYADTDQERALFAALDATEPAIRTAVAAEDFPAAMSAIAALRTPVDAFFEAVQVNSDNQILRRNRLNLLSQIRAAGAQIADFTRIEG